MWLTQLLKQHAGDVFSIKGLLCIAGSPHKHVFTGVHMMVQFGVASRAWAAGEARMSRVVITCNDQLDREELLAALRECASRYGVLLGVVGGMGANGVDVVAGTSQ